MKSLMAIIDKLDIRRAQVEIEAIVVEVQVNKAEVSVCNGSSMATAATA